MNFNLREMCGVVLAAVCGFASVSCATVDEPVDAENTENRVVADADDPASDIPPTALVLAGNSYIKIVEPAKIVSGDYHEAVTWQWDATTCAKTLSLAEAKMDHVGDGKFNAEANRMLVISSYGWTVGLEYPSGKTFFWSKQTPNAHSAEWLPGNKIAVACSDGGDEVQIYDTRMSNRVLASAPLTSAHGVAWMERDSVLYAVGGNQLALFKLKGLDTDSPSIKLIKSITAPRVGLHDLTKIDDNTLCLGGRNCYLFDVQAETFTALPFFNGRKGLKSLNYNPANGEMWYTDATEPEGDYTWSTQTVRHVDNPLSATGAGLDVPTARSGAVADPLTFKVPDMNLYKVRVMRW